MKKITPYILQLFILMLALLQAPIIYGAESDNIEYKVKAGFLYNFFKFVEWPVEAFGPPDAPLKLGLITDKKSGNIIENHINAKIVRGRKLLIVRSDNIQELLDCQMIFIGNSQPEKIHHILNILQKRNILSVGESRGFMTDGGIINLVLKKNKVRIEINHSAAERAGLKISSKLLQVAQTVIRETKQ